MRFIFQYPEVHGTDGDMLDSGPVADVAIAAEAAGWDGLAFTEHPVPGHKWLVNGGHQALDPFVALGHAAAVTKRVKLLTYLAVVPYRNPFMLAKSAATVDKLSNGRMILGAGTGYLKSEFFALGVDFEERNELFDEALDVLALHWAGETFSYKGKHFDARDVIARPRPVQSPIPIWIGGNAKVVRRRVAQRAQGWMPLVAAEAFFTTTRTAGLTSLEDVAEKIVEVRAEAGVRAAEIEFVLAYSAADLFDAGTDVGRHREALARMERAGVTWCIVAPDQAPPAETLSRIERFGTTYIAP